MTIPKKLSYKSGALRFGCANETSERESSILLPNFFANPTPQIPWEKEPENPNKKIIVSQLKMAKINVNPVDILCRGFMKVGSHLELRSGFP